MTSLKQKLISEFPEMKIKENEPLAPFTSFKIGGPAELFAEPDSEESLALLLRLLSSLGVKPFILGRGTNLLVSDKGIPGITIRIADGLSSLSVCGNEITAGAGVTMASLAVFARDNSLTGLEFAHGIPGSVGGGVFMNAGAYGGEIGNVCRGVYALSSCGDRLYSEDNDFSYRHSSFEDNGHIIVGARFSLSEGDKTAIGEKMKELSMKRSASQPLGLPSAGSAFKRPKEGYAAAMIDAAGLKGFTVGGARVSEKHAGFIVTDGKASFSDVVVLIDKVREAVYKNCGTLLEPEIKIIG